MKQSVLNRVSDLHKKVIHGNEYSNEEYLLEDKTIKKLNSATINLICKGCFPLIANPGWQQNKHPIIVH